MGTLIPDMHECHCKGPGYVCHRPCAVADPLMPAIAEQRRDAKVKSDGGSSSYYQIPKEAVELQDLIEHKRMNFSIGNIFKACYRLGEKAGNDRRYDLNKIIFFAQRELALLDKEIA